MNVQALLNQMIAIAGENQQVYLVGGAVRDRFTGAETHDLDFVTGGSAIALARRAAGRLGGALYVLDAERDTARVLLNLEQPHRTVLDFAGLRAENLEKDLLARDFTVNAMAIGLSDQDVLIDPTGGLQDLRNRVVRACSMHSLQEDPLRALRGVRLAVELNASIEAETRGWIREAFGELGRISAERVRDELFRMLEGSDPARCMRVLDALGGLNGVLPGVDGLKALAQPTPHVFDGWEHTLAVLDRLDRLCRVLAEGAAETSADGLTLASVSLWLGRYREHWSARLNSSLSGERSLRGLLGLAALLHDFGKPAAFTTGDDGRIHFYRHEEGSARLAEETGRRLMLSGEEIAWLVRVTNEHMRVHFLAKSGETPSPRAIYRYFRDLGQAGVDVCLLSLADTWGTYAHTLPQEIWLTELRTCRTLLEAFWEQPTVSVDPPRWVGGNDLIQEFGLPPGPRIGQLLDAVREAQAAGEVGSRDEALEYARRWLSGMP